MNPTKINLENIQINEGIAEFYGAMIGDGCLSKYFSNFEKRQRYCILLTGHTHDEPYYRKKIQPIFLKEFGTKGCIRFKNKDNVVRFETSSKRIFNFLQNMGFPVGLKGNIRITDVIFNDNNLSLACLRGIFDTDGSIYKRYSKKYKNHAKKYNYKNIEFKMNSKNIIKQIKAILGRNRIKTSNIRKNAKAYVLNIHNQKFVRLFFELVKPSNPYHTERFLNLK